MAITAPVVLPWSAAASPSPPSACSKALARPCSRWCTLLNAIRAIAKHWALKLFQVGQAPVAAR